MSKKSFWGKNLFVKKIVFLLYFKNLKKLFSIKNDFFLSKKSFGEKKLLSKNCWSKRILNKKKISVKKNGGGNFGEKNI